MRLVREGLQFGFLFVSKEARDFLLWEPHFIERLG